MTRSVIWHKVWFDLWHNKSRTLIVVLSIAAGLFTLGGIFGMIDQLLLRMDAAHQAVSPSEINFILRDLVDQQTVDELKTLPQVTEIDPINQISVRYKTAASDPWEIGTLVSRPDYTQQELDLVELKEGTWPQGEDLAIERLSSQYNNIELGDAVTFHVNGEEVTFTLSGKIRHPFVQPPMFGGQAHFFSDPTGLEQFGIPAGMYNQLLVRTESDDAEEIRATAAALRARLAEKGFGVVVVMQQDTQKHWGRPFVEGITVILGIMAVASIVLSVILVLNTLTAVITQQVDQIGILKAIGGRRGHIAMVYFAEVLIYGVLALLIALPASVLFANGMTAYFLNFFNIDTTTFIVSPRAVIITLLAGIIAPLLAASLPVLKGSRISIREAIASYGLGGDFGRGWLDQAIEHFGNRFLPTSYAVSLGNLFRRKGRLALTLLVLTTAGVMFLVVMSLISSIQLTLDEEEARQSYDVRIGFTRNQSAEQILSLVEAVPGVGRAETWYSRNAAILRAGERVEETTGLGGQLIGIPADTRLYQPLIAQGRWLEPGDQGAIVLAEETARNNQIEPGDTVTLDLGELGSQDWEVIGTYRMIYGGGLVIEPIYASIEAVQQATGQSGIATQVIIQGDQITSLAEETALADELKSTLEDQGIALDFYTTTAKRDARVYANNQYATVVSMLLSLAILVGVVGGIGLMGSLWISVVERTREIGVLRAIGGESKTIRGLFIMEGLIQGLLCFLISVPLALLLAPPLANLLGQTMIDMNLSFQFNWVAVGIWLALVLTIAIFAALWPANSAGRISVRESLAYA